MITIIMGTLLVWVAFTAVMLCWIVGASLSTSREIFSGQIYKFASGSCPVNGGSLVQVPGNSFDAADIDEHVVAHT